MLLDESCRVATRADRSRLQQFICTDPHKPRWEPHRGTHHPRPWELDAQSSIRNPQPPLGGGDEMIVVGVVDGPIQGVCNFGPSSDSQMFGVWLLAVALDCQGQGVGRTLLRAALDETARLNPLWPVVARIHPENEPSKALFASMGFVMEIPCGVGEPLDLWMYMPDMETVGASGDVLKQASR